MRHSVISYFIIPVFLVVTYVSGCTSSRPAAEEQHTAKPLATYPAHQSHEIQVPDYVSPKADCNLIEEKQRDILYYVDSVRYARSTPEPIKAEIKELIIYRCKDLISNVSDSNDRIILVTTEKVSKDKKGNITIRLNSY